MNDKLKKEIDRILNDYYKIDDLGGWQIRATKKLLALILKLQSETRERTLGEVREVIMKQYPKDNEFRMSISSPKCKEDIDLTEILNEHKGFDLDKLLNELQELKK